MVKTKAQIIEELHQAAGNPLEKEALEQLTVKELTALLESDGEPPVEATQVATVRRKVNRGSMRRINKASDTFRGALKAFADELDRQAWVEDDKGARVASIALVAYLRQVERGCHRRAEQALHRTAGEGHRRRRITNPVHASHGEMRDAR
jgi:hypothetical protein